MLSIIATAEISGISPNHPNHFPRELQTALMDNFFASISVEGNMKFSKENSSHDYCDWSGVTCDAGVVTRVLYGNTQCGNFNIHALPSTVESISMQSSRQKYALQTRALPRELRMCFLFHNELFGSVDLRTLPGKLIRIDLQSNKLTGPIDLTSLPCTLERLYIYWNHIVQSVVFYDHLPPKSILIYLVSNHSPTNQIGKVCSVNPDMIVKNKAIFGSIPVQNVQ